MLYFKAYNRAKDLVLSPELQFFSNASPNILEEACVLFNNKDEALKACARFISPKFKVIEINI